MHSYRNLFIAVFSLITVSHREAFAQSSESAKANSSVEPDGLPPPPDPQLFYNLYDGRQNPNMLLDVSRLWDTDVQLQHFQFLHDQIDDPKVDQDTKTYARQILNNAQERLEETFDTLGVRIDYDLMDIIREIKNIQDDQPPVCKKLRRLLLQADREASKLEHEKVQKEDDEKHEKSHGKEKPREKKARKKRRVRIKDAEVDLLKKTKNQKKSTENKNKTIEK